MHLFCHLDARDVAQIYVSEVSRLAGCAHLVCRVRQAAMDQHRLLKLPFDHRETFRHVFGNPADEEVRTRLKPGESTQAALAQQIVIEDTIHDPEPFGRLQGQRRSIAPLRLACWMERL